MNSPLFNQNVAKLAMLLEEGTRASTETVRRFVEPMRGTLRRAKSKRHHLVFGRRGSGKSSLLYKSSHSLSNEGHAVAHVDLEPFKGHHYPDVLISVLLASLERFKDWVENHSSMEPKRKWYWPFAKSSLQDQGHKVLQTIVDELNDLNQQLYLTDGSDLTQTERETNRASISGSAKVAGKAGAQGFESKIESEIASNNTVTAGSQLTEVSRRSKIDYLHRKILTYRKIFTSLSDWSNTSSYLFLDDLYHLGRNDQPVLLDYFHRIAKGNNLWLKVGTIKHRTKWYIHSPQPIGLKIGDDVDDIDLDLTLERFSTTKEFLSQVLRSYIQEADAPKLDALITDGALDRLVMASGGVTRDFLQLFRRAIDEAVERLTKDPSHSRGDRISTEDINVASGAYGETKRQEFQKDTLEDQHKLQEAFDKIRIFCIECNAANIFLIDQEIDSEDVRLVDELVDLRLVHHVRSRVTISNKPGRIYRALLLDVSQYTGERKRRAFNMIEFWKSNREAIRKASYIYDASQTEEVLKQKKLPVADESPNTGINKTLFD